MSGFLALLNTDRRPCDPALLEQLRERLAFRGPDGQGCELRSHVGLASSLFKTARESEHETQPFTFDNQVWIVADCRVDDRERLVSALRDRGRRALLSDPDVELILHSYHAWGEDCVRHLLGDFAFVIWDERTETLFAARDHFGVRQLYYSVLPGVVLLSNTMSCLRAHPAVSLELNEYAIGDYLLFGDNQDPATTALADVQRLPPAHKLRWRDGTTKLARYWELPEHTEPLHWKKHDILERFRELMCQAVGDRMRLDRIAISLSGGMDSSAVAAAACLVGRDRNPETSLAGWTYDIHELLPGDEEARFAALNARKLGIEHHVFSLSSYRPYESTVATRVWIPPGPADWGYYQSDWDFANRAADTSRVVITGQGGDAVFRGSQEYVLRGLRSRRAPRVLWEIGRHLVTTGRFPPLGFRSRLKARFGKAPPEPRFPDWIRSDFGDRTGLAERWDRSHQPCEFKRSVIRPEAYYFLSDFWQGLFLAYDAEWTGVPLDYAHPLFDLRLLDFLLQTPPIPWFGAKTLVREAWSEILPREVLQRPKTPLVGLRMNAHLSRGEAIFAEDRCGGGIEKFLVADQLPELDSACLPESGEGWQVRNAIAVARWIDQVSGGSFQQTDPFAQFRLANSGVAAR